MAELVIFLPRLLFIEGMGLGGISAFIAPSISAGISASIAPSISASGSALTNRPGAYIWGAGGVNISPEVQASARRSSSSFSEVRDPQWPAIYTTR